MFHLDLTVQRGETFGFIGPDGAGKTTTIRLLMDLIRADRGQASLLVMDSRRDSVAIKRRVGYLPGELVSFPGGSPGSPPPVAPRDPVIPHRRRPTPMR